MSEQSPSSERASTTAKTSSAGPWLAAFLIIGLTAAYLVGVADVTGPGLFLLESALVMGAIAILVLVVPVFYLLVTHRRTVAQNRQYAHALDTLQARIRNAESAQDAQGNKVASHANEIRDIGSRTQRFEEDLRTVAYAQEQQDSRSADQAQRLAAAEDGLSLVGADLKTTDKAVERLEVRAEKTRQALDASAAEAEDVRARFEQHLVDMEDRYETFEQRLAYIESGREADRDWVQRVDGQRKELAASVADVATLAGEASEFAHAVDERVGRLSEEAAVDHQRLREQIDGVAATQRDAVLLTERMTEVQRGTDAAVGRAEETARNAISRLETVEAIQRDQLERITRADEVAHKAAERTDDYHDFTEALERGYQEMNKTVADLAEQTQANATAYSDQASRLAAVAEMARQANERWTPHTQDHAEIRNRFEQIARRLDEMDERLRTEGGWDEPIGSLVSTVDTTRGSVTEHARRLESLEANVAQMEGRVPLTIGDLKQAEGPKGAGGRPVRDIEGVGSVYARRLRKVGIQTVADLRNVDPQALGPQVQVSPNLVSEWKDMANLMRVDGIGPQYSEMLVKSGYRAIADLAVADPDEVLADLERTKASRQMPLNRAQIGLSVVTRWVQAAREQVERDGEMTGFLEVSA